MRNLRLEIEYDGSAYYGWQRQLGFSTIQQKLEEVIERVTGKKTVLYGSGRTDTGVHALHQIANFKTSCRLPEEKILRALNFFLPRDIAVLKCETVDPNFHSRFDVRSKRYLYFVRSSRSSRPLGRRYFHWVPYPLDLEKMRKAARAFLGNHDFRSFSGAGRVSRNTRRTIHSFKIFCSKGRFFFVVQGSGFLLHMVRTMIGTLLEVGRGKLSPAQIRGILKACDRSKAGPTAPALGLFLIRVKYKGRFSRSSRREKPESYSRSSCD